MSYSCLKIHLISEASSIIAWARKNPFRRKMGDDGKLAWSQKRNARKNIIHGRRNQNSISRALAAAWRGIRALA